MNYKQKLKNILNKSREQKEKIRAESLENVEARRRAFNRVLDTIEKSRRHELLVNRGKLRGWKVLR